MTSEGSFGGLTPWTQADRPVLAGQVIDRIGRYSRLLDLEGWVTRHMRHARGKSVAEVMTDCQLRMFVIFPAIFMDGVADPADASHTLAGWMYTVARNVMFEERRDGHGRGLIGAPHCLSFTGLDALEVNAADLGGVADENGLDLLAKQVAAALDPTADRWTAWRSAKQSMSRLLAKYRRRFGARHTRMLIDQIDRQHPEDKARLLLRRLVSDEYWGRPVDITLINQLLDDQDTAASSEDDTAPADSGRIDIDRTEGRGTAANLD